MEFILPFWVLVLSFMLDRANKRITDLEIRIDNLEKHND